jgi:hypothetical protein
MRITELLEGQHFNDLDWIKNDGDKNVPDFDLAEDLVYFMNNDDDTYRRHLYPKISLCIARIGAKKKTHSDIFKDAVIEGYKNYIRKFPISKLPDSIDEKTCTEACERMHEEVCQHISDGKYKD